MPIEPGQQLLHYRIVEKIGEGGMGVGYRSPSLTLVDNWRAQLAP